MNEKELTPEFIRSVRDRIALFVRIDELMFGDAYRGFSWHEKWRLYRLYIKAARGLPSQRFLAQLVHASRLLDIAIDIAEKEKEGANNAENR